MKRTIIWNYHRSARRWLFDIVIRRRKNREPTALWAHLAPFVSIVGCDGRRYRYAEVIAHCWTVRLHAQFWLMPEDLTAP